ncbi:hypothetical protein [Burkholderia seminalis]|uniref:hypothetical protein n=1 Tax=Burkholderia seminalis TaxID=488731 RepID=UPI0031DB6108
MKIKWGYVRFAALLVLIALAPYGADDLWTRYINPQHSPKDFWDIATSVGTCGAVIVALYVTTSERRRRAADALIGARIAAGFVTYRLGILRSEVASVRKWTDETLASGSLPTNFLYQIQTLQAAARCSIDEIRSMQPLPNHCAIQIAGAQDRVDVAIKFFEKHAIWTQLGTLENEVIASLGTVVLALLESENLLANAITTCVRESEAVYAEMNVHSSGATGNSPIQHARQSIVASHPADSAS